MDNTVTPPSHQSSILLFNYPRSWPISHITSPQLRMRYCHFSWHHLEVFQLLMLLPVMPDKFSRHVGQFPTSCSDPLTSEQGLASDIVICLQLGHPEFMHYQETSYLEKEKLYGRRRRAGVIRAGRRGVRGTDTPHYLGQQPKKASFFQMQDLGLDLAFQHWSIGIK